MALSRLDGEDPIHLRVEVGNCSLFIWTKNFVRDFPGSWGQDVLTGLSGFNFIVPKFQSSITFYDGHWWSSFFFCQSTVRVSFSQLNPSSFIMDYAPSWTTWFKHEQNTSKCGNYSTPSHNDNLQRKLRRGVGPLCHNRSKIQGEGIDLLSFKNFAWIFNELSFGSFFLKNPHGLTVKHLFYLFLCPQCLINDLHSICVVWKLCLI